MAKFEWTDESVKGFAHVYASSQYSTHVNFPYDISNYKGKLINEKLEQFKLDFSKSEEKLREENESLHIKVQRLETLLKSAMSDRGYVITKNNIK